MEIKEIIDKLKEVLELNGMDVHDIKDDTELNLDEDSAIDISFDLEDEFDTIFDDDFTEIKSPHWQTFGSLVQKLKTELK